MAEALLDGGGTSAPSAPAPQAPAPDGSAFNLNDWLNDSKPAAEAAPAARSAPSAPSQQPAPAGGGFNLGNWLSDGSSVPAPAPQPAPAGGGFGGWFSGLFSHKDNPAPADQLSGSGAPSAYMPNSMSGAKWESPLTLLYRALNVFGGIAEEGAKASHNSGMIPGLPLAYQPNSALDQAAPLGQRAGDALRAVGTGVQRAMAGDDVGFGNAIREAAKGMPVEAALTRPLFGATVNAGVPSAYLPDSMRGTNQDMPTPSALAKLDTASALGVPLDIAGQMGAAKLLGLVGKLGGSAANLAKDALAPRMAQFLETKAGQQVGLAGDALRSVGRDIGGQFSFEGGFSGLPEGKDVAQLMREHQGGIMSGQVQNRVRMQPLANGLVNATPEEKATLTFLTEMPTTAEAQAKVVRETAAAAEEAQKQAVLNYKAPSPFDATGIEPQAARVNQAMESLPGREFSAVQNAALDAGLKPEEVIDDIARKVYGYPPGGSLSPVQRAQVMRAFGDAKGLNEGYTNLADIIKAEGAQGPGMFGTAVKNKVAMDPAGADPFNMSLEQRHQSVSDDLANLVREHKWTSDKYDFNVNQLARDAAKDINLANGDARNQLWQEILSHGKIRPGSGSAGAELTRGLPSFLKDARGGMGLDELASSMRNGMSEQDLVNEIMGVTGKRPVTATSAEAIKEAEQRFLSTPEGQRLRDTLSAHSQQIEGLQQELGPLQQELSAKRGPFDDLPAGEFPRPSWSETPAAEAVSSQAKPIAETAADMAPTGGASSQAKVIAEGALTQANGDQQAAIASLQQTIENARVKAAEGSPLAKVVLKQQEEALAHLQASGAATGATAGGGLSDAANAVVQDALRNNGGDKAAAVTDLLEHLKAMGRMTGDPEIPAQMNTWREAITHLGGTPPAEMPQLTADHLRQWLENPQNLDQAATRNIEAYGWQDKPGSKFWTKERDGIEHILRNEVLPGVEAGNPQAWRVRLGPGGSVGDMVGESLASEAKAAEAAGGAAGAGARAGNLSETLQRLRGRGEYQWRIDIANFLTPEPYGTFDDVMKTVPEGVRNKFQVHGLAATNQDANLVNLLENGIDTSRPFHSGPPIPGQYGVDTTRTRAPYLLLSDPGATIVETGVKNVVVNDAASATIPKLREAFPGVNFMSPDEAAQFMQTGRAPAGIGTAGAEAAGGIPGAGAQAASGAAEAGGIPGGSGAAGAGGAQEGAQASHNINLDAVPEQYRHMAQPVMDKYGHLIPDIRSLTDEAYAKIKGFAPDTGYVEYYTPRISRDGQAGDSAYTKFMRSLTDERAVPTKDGQMAGALTNRPGLTKGRTLDTMGAFADNATAHGGHAVFDQVDALLTHLDKATQAEQAVVLRDKLLGLGENVAVKAKEVPPGFMDMSHIPGWDGISVRKPYGKALEQLLAPDARGPVATVYDKAMGQMKEAAFYNPAVHGKNLAYRAFIAGNSPIPSEAAMAEVRQFGPTLRNLVEHGGATEYATQGEQGAQKLYRLARQANGQTTLGDKWGIVKDVAHNSLWEYDKALRVDYANKLRAQGLSWPEVAKQVNETYGASLDPTKFNQNFTKRAFFTPAWMVNNLKFTAKNALNPRTILLNDLRQGLNKANTGHGTEDNAAGKEEYMAITGQRPDGAQTFLNPGLPDKDLREIFRNPLDFLWQRSNPLITSPLGMAIGNSRPLDRGPDGLHGPGLKYDAPGAGGPLLGYGSNGFGPDVSLYSQAALRQALPFAGFPVGTMINEGSNVARSKNPLRDFLLRMGGTYASDANEPLSKAYDTKTNNATQKKANKAITRRAFKRSTGP